MPKLHLTSKDKALIVAIVVFLSVVTVTGWWLVGESTLSVTLILAAIVILVFVLEAYRRLEALQFTNLSRTHEIENSQRRYYEQVESLLFLYFTIKPEYPVPKTRGYPASPDFLRQIYDLIQDETPSLVVEASSGVSTLIAAYSLRHVGRGRVVSLEHDPKYAEITRSIISRHGLQAISTVVHAPLKEYDVNGQSWLWYDLTSLEREQRIDLLLVDGPPGSIQELARYPALPLLFGQLSEKATIVLDDGNRLDEKRIIEQWLREFDHLSSEFIPLEKGCYVIHRTKNPGSA